MGAAILVAFGICAIGYATLRAAGLTKGVAGLGLAPAVGLATCIVWSSWLASIGTPPVAGGWGLGALTLAGAVFAWRDREAVRGVVDTRPLWLAWLAASLVVPSIAMGIGFAGQQAPLSTHDGAFHIETIDGIRTGQARPDWYPPGLAATFATWLQLLPWLDSAAGGFDLGLALALLMPLAIFGVAVAVWADLRLAGVAAVLAGLTYLFGYYNQIWSGWPLQAGLTLTLGTWVIGLEYVNRPDARRAAVAGVLVGALLLTHGTEVYSAAIVVGVVAVANARVIRWRVLPRHVAFALALAVVCAAPYLPTLLHWAGTGGASTVGFEDGGALELAARSRAVGDSLLVFGLEGLGIDVPVRLVLLVFGLSAVLRERGQRSVLWLASIFGSLAMAFALLNGLPVVRQVYAATYPWGLPYRQLMLVSIMGVLIAARGATASADGYAGWVRRLSRPRLRPRLVRLGRALTVTWLVLSTWALTLMLATAAPLVSSYSPDDALAMAWLRSNAEPGALVVNDTFADAGIWAPYKAGTPVLIPRGTSGGADSAARELILTNITRLDQRPSEAAAACALHVRYAYYGAKQTAWQVRKFPPRAEMQAAPALEEVFRSGKASVFRVRTAC